MRNRNYGEGTNDGTTAAKERNYIIPDFKARRLMGLEMIEQVKLKSAKRMTEFAETGHFNKPLPKSLVDLTEQRNQLLAGYCELRLSLPEKKGGKFKPLSYEEMTLLGFVMDEKRRTKVLQKIIEHAKEKNDRKMLKAAIQIGLDYHIPKPLLEFAPKMKVEDHLLFLKDIAAADGMTKEVLHHINVVGIKAEMRKPHKARSKIFGELSQVEKRIYQKTNFFERALQEADQIITPEIRQKQYRALSHIALSSKSKKNPYDVFLADERLNVEDLPGQRENQSFVSLSVMMPLKMITDRILQYRSPVVKMKAFSQLATLYEDPGKNMIFYRLAAKEILKYKTPRARGRNFKELMKIAPTKESYEGTHELFLKNAPFDMMLSDTLSMNKDRSRNLNLILPALAMLHDQKDMTLVNQRLYAQHGQELRELSVGVVMDEAIRP